MTQKRLHSALDQGVERHVRRGEMPPGREAPCAGTERRELAFLLAPHRSAGTPDAPHAVVAEARTVLLVDDDADLRSLVSAAFGRAGGWDVLLAASGPEGIAMAERHGPDVILLDVSMPQMDGPSTLARLRQNPTTAEIDVIFLTARVHAAELERLGSLGARGVISKPFDPLLLASEVSRHLGD
jgi:two-component system, OmpR family, response regulator